MKKIKVLQWCNEIQVPIFILIELYCVKKTLANQGVHQGKTIKFNVMTWGWHVLMEM
jgi:hypothetical protein